MPVVLVLHDVFGNEGPAATGFAGEDAHRYKLSREQLGVVFDALAGASNPPVVDLHRRGAVGIGDLALSFDDGGLGASLHTADLLERRGWRGYFLIVSDRIGTLGFMTREQVRELHSRGHVVGTHTRSHPVPLSRLSAAAIAREWGDSIRSLEELLAAPVEVGSVPGGFYSRRVGEQAEACGVRLLFTSEPRRTISRIGQCIVVGRFNVSRTTAPSTVAALVRGDRLPRLRAWAYWNAKKIPKLIGGDAWLVLRRHVLRRGEEDGR